MFGAFAEIAQTFEGVDTGIVAVGERDGHRITANRFDIAYFNIEWNVDRIECS